jgi:hypothetical protein
MGTSEAHAVMPGIATTGKAKRKPAPSEHKNGATTNAVWKGPTARPIALSADFRLG